MIIIFFTGITKIQETLSILRSSETTRKDIYLQKEPSVHRSSHHYPKTDNEWGWYLAGLIDADGSFSDVSISQPNLTICFHIKDIHLAYKIRSFLTFGTISKIKNKNACKFVLTNQTGLIFLLKILNKKLQHKQKQERCSALCIFYKILPLDNNNLNSLFNFNNHWLAGFIDGAGSLQIKVLKRKNKTEVRLQLQIELMKQTVYLLYLIKTSFGGNLYFRKKTNSYYYNTTSFFVYKKFINYLDHYHLCSNKYKEYVIWRRAYFYRTHFLKIIKMKETLNVLKK